MIPSGYKEDKLYSVKPRNGDGDFTFTRASTGTRVNSEGYIEEVPWNIFTDSQDFNLWGKSTNVVLSNSYNSPINTNTAYAIGHDGTTAQYFITKNSVLVPAQNVTYSAYVKKGTKNWIILRVGGTCLQYMDIENFVLGSFVFAAPLSHSFEDVGNGWIRVSITVLGTGLSQNLNIYVAEGNGNPSVTGILGDKLLYVWGGQLVKGDSPKPYIKTTNRLDIPRLDYSGGATRPTLLLEGQRTNLVTYSEQLDSNTKLNVVVISNDIISPDGTQDADKLETTSNNSYKLLKTNSVSFVSGTDYTFSFYAKKGTTDFIQLITTNTLFGATSEWANFDLNNGVVSLDNYGGASIEDIGDGWYRCKMTSTCVSSGTDGWYVSVITSGTSTRAETTTNVVDVYVWGLQVETGSYPTSYIPTRGTSVTRTNDKLPSQILATPLTTEGTIFIDFAKITQGNANYGFLNLSNQNSYKFYFYGGGMDVYNNAAFIVNRATLEPNNSKVAVSWNGTDVKVYINGNDRTKSGAVASLNNTEKISFNDTSDICNMKAIILFSEQLTDTELATLTTI